jgi:hypothetical protein
MRDTPGATTLISCLLCIYTYFWQFSIHITFIPAIVVITVSSDNHLSLSSVVTSLSHIFVRISTAIFCPVK